jgi:hypothetical protein
LDAEIEEIRRLMLKSIEEIVSNRWRMRRRDCSGNMNKPLQHKVQKPRGKLTASTTQQQ